MECHLPLDLRRAEVGGAPRSPPSTGPPLTSAALLHAQPRAAPSTPQRAARLQPARGHSKQPARPGPASAAPPTRAGPRPAEWAAPWGGGVREASPPPGRGHAQAPRVTRVWRGPRRGWTADSGSLPPKPGGCVSGDSVGSGPGRDGSPSTPTRAPGLAAAGHCSRTKGQAPLRPPFPLRISSGNPPRHTLRLRVRAGGRGPAVPHYPWLPGPFVPAQHGGQGWVGACPIPPSVGGPRICGGGATWRPTRRTHSVILQSWGPLPHSPLSTSLPQAQAGPGSRSV